jgi:F-type H+-transporting ATPase subunit b
MNIIPDPIQVLLNTLPFLITVVGMYLIILKPMVTYLSDRLDAIEGGHKEAEAIEAKINARMADYEAQLEQAKAEVGALRAERRVSAQQAYDEVIDKARGEADTRVAGVLDEISVAQQAAAAQLKGMSGDIANQMAGRVLGRPLTGAAS